MNAKERIAAYYDLLREFPQTHLKVPVDPTREKYIVMDPDHALAIEMAERDRLAAKGQDPEQAAIGIRREDAFSWHLVEPQYLPPSPKFPKGLFSIWHRTVWKDTVRGKSVIVVAVTEKLKLVVIAQDRHGSQRWELEACGGGSIGATTWEEVAWLELLEETGYERIGELIPVGGNDTFFVRDPATATSHQKTFIVMVRRTDRVQDLDQGEVMTAPFEIAWDTLLAAYANGTMSHPSVPGRIVHLHNGVAAHLIATYTAARRTGLL